MNDDLLETSKAFMGILILIAVGIFLYFSFENISSKEMTMGSESGLVVKHLFEGDVHTVVGTVDLPTPCHRLRTEVSVAESNPETVTIVLTPETEAELCAQAVTPQTFLASFQASVGASIYARVNGVNAPLEIIEVSKKEDLESF
ncbi:MAG: hypothetical protein ISR99_00695 [Parcubacteria group bacterium]|nr:hypothetical protein [Parcubacteria group bacterium]